MRRAALYARVSTRRQEHEATIESQLDQLLRYAQEHELEVTPGHQFVDQAVSGKRLARPGLDQLRDAVVAGEFEEVLCLSPDRLARNLGAQQVVLDELERYQVGVVFLNQPQRDESPQSKLMLEIQGAFAEYERTLICERMRRGRLYRLRQGQSVSNLVPYGYRYQHPDRTHANSWVVIEAHRSGTCPPNLSGVHYSIDQPDTIGASPQRSADAGSARQAMERSRPETCPVSVRLQRDRLLQLSPIG